jgi:hypothetical protein
LLLDVYDSRGGWPIHQWVRRELQNAGLDLDDELRRLPGWQHNYRPVNVMQTGVGDVLESKIVPTVHGLVHSGHPTAARLVEMFLAAVKVAEERQRIAPLDSMKVQTVRISASMVAAPGGRRILLRQSGTNAAAAGCARSPIRRSPAAP